MYYNQRRRKKRSNRLLCALFFVVALLLAVLVAGRTLEVKKEILEPFDDERNRIALLEVPYIPQNPEYPTGCEAVSAVMALRFCGYDITPAEFIDEYLVCDDFYTKDGMLYGPDPSLAFVGDPRRKDSFGCYAPVIEHAIKEYLSKSGSVTDTTGCALETLCTRYTDRGVPVLIWASSKMRETQPTRTWTLSTGESFTWIAGEHCLVLVGYDENYYYLNDPQVGAAVAYRRVLVEARYRELGKQSLAIAGEIGRP